jgi:arylsulfatase
MKKAYTLLGLGALAAMTGQAQQRPNIIYIMCDDMGYGDLACYGQKYIATPNLDRMAAEGMRFTQAYAGSPVSAPSRATLMTGTAQRTHPRARQQGILARQGCAQPLWSQH